MKSIFGTSTILICFFALTFSCTKENTSVDNSLDSEFELDLMTRSDISPDSKVFSEVVKDKKITKEFIPVIIDGLVDKKEFVDTKVYSIEPVTKNGRNLMFVVNFTKGGWVIVSGRYDLESQILAFESSGTFNPNQIESPECNYWFETTCDTIEREMIDDEDRDRFDYRDFDDQYFWVLLPVTTQYSSEISSSVASFVTTKWGQGFPWNYRCPSINGVQCKTGCVAVAYAQVFYYLHNNIGKPNMLFHQIDTNYTWTGTSYYPYHTMTNRNSNSTRWSSMPLSNPGVQTTGTNYVGDLMIELGQYLSMEYKSTGSYAYLLPGILSNYAISADGAYVFNQSTAISQLDNGLPLIVDGKDEDDDGHAWVMDGYQIHRQTADLVSQWRRFPVSEINNYNEYVCFSESEMRLLYPNVVEYQLDHSYTYSYTTKFGMNWGWDGDDDGYFSMNEIPYNNNNLMVFNFH